MDPAFQPQAFQADAFQAVRIGLAAEMRADSGWAGLEGTSVPVPGAAGSALEPETSVTSARAIP